MKIRNLIGAMATTVRVVRYATEFEQQCCQARLVYGSKLAEEHKTEALALAQRTAMTATEAWHHLDRKRRDKDLGRL